MRDCVGPEIENACVNPVARSVILLENLCFLMEEEGKGKEASGNKIKAEQAKIDTFWTALLKLRKECLCQWWFGSCTLSPQFCGWYEFATEGWWFLMKELNYSCYWEEQMLQINTILHKVNLMSIDDEMVFTFSKELHNMEDLHFSSWWRRRGQDGQRSHVQRWKKLMGRLPCLLTSSLLKIWWECLKWPSDYGRWHTCWMDVLELRYWE